MTSRQFLVAQRGSIILSVQLLATAAVSGQQTTELVSVDSSGNQANSHSTSVSVSADGRYVAFQSSASNLAPGDVNGGEDIFVHDRQTGLTELVSVSTSGAQANDESSYPTISADGRYVAFQSFASNLGGITDGSTTHVYVRDRQTGSTELISDIDPGDQEDADSGSASISADGRHVTFISSASNVVLGDTNGVDDVFVHDRQTGVTERVNVGPSGVQANASSSMSYFSTAISADGRYVAFSSSATNLVLGDANGKQDTFVHDLQAGVTELVSVDSSGVQANADSAYSSISGDGRCVVFESAASNLVPGDTNGWSDVFVHDRQTGITERASVDSSGVQAELFCITAAISGNGRYVSFNSFAANLVPFDSNETDDVFVHDRETSITEIVSVSSSGLQGNERSTLGSLSADGRYVGFTSWASNLVAGDTNGAIDVFLRDRSCSADFASYCTAGTSASGCLASLSACGTPSATAPSGFTLSASTVEGQKDGLFFFGTNGQQANPWGNGTSYQCVVPPVVRTPTMAGVGTIGLCDGSFALDLNALWCPTCVKPAKNPGAAAVVQAQLWYRDPLSTSNQTTSLSDAIEFSVGF